MTAPTVYPTPFFEGSEKRIEIDFCGDAPDKQLGLRKLTRAQLDEVTQLAACTIISTTSNDLFDSYVLSESSMFVYPTKFVMKTCGTTKLLACVPRVVEMAAALKLQVQRVKFTRASYLAPEKQLQPHTSFTDELVALHCVVQRHALHEEAYVLGDPGARLQWHVYVASAPHAGTLPSVCTLEMCMLELDPAKAAQFVRDDKFVSSADTTKSSGIKYLLPDATIDDYVFEPCGYSMNGIEEGGFMTIHITPEDGFSYASVELSGFAPDKFCPSAILNHVVNIFKPGQLCVSLSVSHMYGDTGAWGATLDAPAGYSCRSGLCQELTSGGRVVFYNLSYSKEGQVPLSPRGMLDAAFETDNSSESESDVIMNTEVLV